MSEVEYFQELFLSFANWGWGGSCLVFFLLISKSSLYVLKISHCSKYNLQVFLPVCLLILFSQTLNVACLYATFSHSNIFIFCMVEMSHLVWFRIRAIGRQAFSSWDYKWIEFIPGWSFIFIFLTIMGTCLSSYLLIGCYMYIWSAFCILILQHATLLKSHIIICNFSFFWIFEVYNYIICK